MGGTRNNFRFENVGGNGQLEAVRIRTMGTNRASRQAGERWGVKTPRPRAGRGPTSDNKMVVSGF